jgi:hypothetical protein
MQTRTGRQIVDSLAALVAEFDSGFVRAVTGMAKCLVVFLVNVSKNILQT